MKKFISSQQFRTLPKVDLHRHLDCSMRWSTFSELAPKLGLSWPQTMDEQKKQYLITEPMRNLEEVLRKFTSSQKVLASEEILTRLAFEACEDAYNEGICLLELRYAPTFISEGHPHLSWEKIHLSFLKGLEKARQKYSLAVGLICIVQRNKPIELADQIVNFAIEHKDSFIGLDLADNEDGFEPIKFAKLFDKARKAGLRITVHSGETPDSRAPQWVIDSINHLGAERIGHGVQIIRDPKAIQFVVQKKIPLEVCPISNWLTQSFPSHEDHPLRLLKKEGVQITINSDDPGIFGTTLNDDYEIAHFVHGFTIEEFHELNNNAVKFSFLSEKEKQKVWT